jgi:hypothetical protein
VAQQWLEDGETNRRGTTDGRTAWTWSGSLDPRVAARRGHEDRAQQTGVHGGRRTGMVTVACVQATVCGGGWRA